MEDRDGDRLRFLFASAFNDSMPTDACVAPELLLDAVDGVLEGADQDAVIDHVSACPVCAEAWRLALLAQREDE